jgi:hypothetical protein
MHIFPIEDLEWMRGMLRNYRPDHIRNPDYKWRYCRIEWGQSTRIDIFLALLTFRIQFSAWPANLDFSMPVRYIT